MSWLHEHLEEFVIPHIGDKATHVFPPLGYFDQEELSVIKNSWRSVKKAAKGKPILLPGRDVWIFEVLARRENYPTLFVPECSRMTVNICKKQIPNLEDYFLFDTGFAGSIPRGLGMQKDSFRLLSHSNNMLDPTNTVQIFPRLSFSRGLALKIESTPKYWESGRPTAPTGSTQMHYYMTQATTDTAVLNILDEKWKTYNEWKLEYTTVDNTTVVQEPSVIQKPAEPVNPITQRFSHTGEFVQAARLTVEIYTNSAPKFVPKHKPMRREVTDIW